jgi:holo-[acyl-carrier protein] synthase
MNVIGHGIDIVSVSRIDRMITEHGERFLARCFAPGESELHRRGGRAAERLAARFAAKEAVLKAMGTGLTSGIAWTDIEVITLPSGEPVLQLHGAAQRAGAARGITGWLVSLSHTGDTAMASVIAIGNDPA